MDKLVNRYCVCLIAENVKNNTLWEGCVHRLDKMTFPNPDKDPTAKKRCIERAQFLRKEVYPNKNKHAISPVVITGIWED